MLVGCLAFCATASAQYKVGEAFVKDGVPCIIIDVDASGQHGLAMSLQPTYKAMKDAKKTGEYGWMYQHKKLKGKVMKQRIGYLVEFFQRYQCDTLRVRTSGMSTAEKTITSRNGRENMDNLIAFCDEKGISLESYFPEYHWALSLGKDWFIPGVAELELWVKTVGFETFGFKNAKGLGMYTKDLKELNSTYAQSLGALGENAVSFKNVMLPYSNTYTTPYIESSTIAQEGKSATSLYLLLWLQKLTTKQWYDMSGSNVMYPYAYAVCKF